MQYAPVAQWIRALVFGTRCRKFESCRVYHRKRVSPAGSFSTVYYIYMETHANVPLKNFTTMRLGGPASQLVEVRNVDELVATYRQAKAQSLSVFILGGGSNVVAHDEGL